MDKLRALEYFVAAAEAGSFAGAARQLGLSVPAVHKLVGALERSVGAALFERTVQGLSLTSTGARYLETCRPLLAELAEADESIGRSTRQASGTLVLGAHSQVVHHLLMPALPRFRARHPEIQFDIRIVTRLADPDAEGVDVFLLQGWPEAGDFVMRRFGLARTLIVAAPAYWAARGVPREPQELAAHDCVLLRNPLGILLDLWEFERGGEKAAVKVGGWLVSNNRQVQLDAVLAGEGVARFNEVTSRQHLLDGSLVPALADWEVQGGAPFNLLLRPSVRRVPRVRVFVDFVTALLRDLQSAEAGASPERPHWHRRGAARASSVLRRRA